MRFWIVFSLGNAVFALLPVLLSRLGHGRATIPKGCKHFLQIYTAAILGMTLTRLAGVEVIQRIGDATGGADPLAFFGLTLVLPIVLVSASLWVWASKRAESQGTQKDSRQASINDLASGVSLASANDSFVKLSIINPSK